MLGSLSLTPPASLPGSLDRRRSEVEWPRRASSVSLAKVQDKYLEQIQASSRQKSIEIHTGNRYSSYSTCLLTPRRWWSLAPSPSDILVLVQTLKGVGH